MTSSRPGRRSWSWTASTSADPSPHRRARPIRDRPGIAAVYPEMTLIHWPPPKGLSRPSHFALGAKDEPRGRMHGYTYIRLTDSTIMRLIGSAMEAISHDRRT